MYFSKTKIRVRYEETDKMGYVYYGKYAEYYEVGRTEMLRNFNITYRYLEENGVMLPVKNLNVKYIKPAFYDDLLTIKTIINELPNVRIKFNYEIYNENNELINIGDTTLVFVDENSRKPINAPEYFLKHLRKYFE